MKLGRDSGRIFTTFISIVLSVGLSLRTCSAADEVSLFESPPGSSIPIEKLEGHIGDEWMDAAQTILPAADGEMEVLIKHDQEYLYLAFDIDDSTEESKDEIQIFSDTLHNGGKSFGQPDDRRYHISRTGQMFGKYTWDAAVAERSGGWQLEGRVSLHSLNNPQPGSTLGLRIYHRDMTSGLTFWPQGSYYPDSWGDLIFAKDAGPLPPQDQPPAPVVEEDGAMVLIPAGEFLMGSDEGRPDEKPAHTVYLDAYYIDKYEVTNAQFCEFLIDKAPHIELSEDHEEYTHPEYDVPIVVRPFTLVYQTEEGKIPLVNVETHYSRIEYNDGRYQAMAGYENHPVVAVSWYGARAYAQWAGKRLPTEAEWERAARGGLVEKQYPWGDDKADSTKANYTDEYEEDTHRTRPVGSYPENKYGLYDVAGNVSEWCSDWYAKDYYGKSPARNPQGPGAGKFRVARGGSWLRRSSAWIRLRCAFRNGCQPDWVTEYHLGFRCAKSSLAQD